MINTVTRQHPAPWMSRGIAGRLALLAAILVLAPVAPAASWQPAEGPLMTRWAKDVSPKNAHPEYPRPQMVRKEWLNLNGLWDFAITGKDAKPSRVRDADPGAFPGRVGAVRRDEARQRERPPLVSPHLRGSAQVAGPARAAALRRGGLRDHRLGQRAGKSASTAAATTGSASTSPTR